MSRIRGKNTKPELLVRRLLHARGYRYRLHGKTGSVRLPGNPDLVFAGRRKVIFVNGCFWHFHDCRAGQHAPKANATFWEAKRTRTRERDHQQRRQLEASGWEVLTVWECELKDSSALEAHLVAFLGA
ncbi:MAG: very short patch repair endonuclease [Pseudarthrobacter sp.]